MTLQRPFRFFAPTLALAMAAAAGAIACGSVVDVASANTPDASVPSDGAPDSPDAQPDAATADALGTAFRIVDVDDNRLLVIRNNGTADVWSIFPAQKLGTLTGDFPSVPSARDT
jgi:hypothetical protein